MMPDPALKEKAKELFVTNGFSMNTILEMLNGEVARKTLYNWRKEENWEDERRQRAVRTQNRRERLEAALDRALDELEIKLDPKLIFAVGKLVAALKSSSTFEFTEEKKDKEDNKKKGLTPEALQEIESKILNL
jgi:hypothetical protein